MKEYVPENENLKMSKGLHKRGRCVNVWPQTYPEKSIITWYYTVKMSTWFTNRARQASCKAGRETVLGLMQLQNGTDQQVPESLTVRYGKYRSCQCLSLKYETCCTEQSPNSDTVGDELWTYLTITKCNGYGGGINSQNVLFAAWTLANIHCPLLQRTVWG